MEFKINGPTSMFQRLVESGFQYSFLDTQYRMHHSLLKVPNQLFYGNQIKHGYTAQEDKQFLCAQVPFLFIDVKNGKERLKGTSFLNREEVDAICGFTDLAVDEFLASKDDSDR